MTFDECWKIVKKVNPKMKDGSTKILVSVSELRRMLELLYDQGRNHVQNARTPCDQCTESLSRAVILSLLK